MVHRCFIVALSLLLLVSCGAAWTPPTGTVLEPLLLQAGDLPPSLAPGQIRADLPPMFDAIPVALVPRFQQFAAGDAPSGGVAVLVYPTEAEAAAGYAALAEGMGASLVPADVGDEGVRNEPNEMVGALVGRAITDLLFRRCSTVVHIRMGVATADETLRTITAYASRLDARLMPVVCP
jgi:hypothetical protein